MRTLLFLIVCAVVVVLATFGIVVGFLSYQPVVAIPALLAGGTLIAIGFIRGERFTRDSIRHVMPLITAGLLSLMMVTLLRGADHLAIVIASGIICALSSVVVIFIEKSRRFLAAGCQTLLLLYVWGLVPLWVMGVRDDWL